ncbi:hypothetical protein T492DRAFT_890540 [Pavlovales sp. CCMP2436]|nr:hypothetical protein T492DRAFT_890540 [Pavlovales sp. CCMP2436]
MADAGPSAMRPGRTSAQLVAAAEMASEPSLLLRTLAGNPLRAIAKLLPDADCTCFRLVCTAFRNHSGKPEKKCVVEFLRARALAVYASEHMAGFVLADPSRMLHLAASISIVGVLEELVDNRQCVLTASACDAAANEGHLDALARLHSRGCPWDSGTCFCAAWGGRLEVLRYAHEHGCPWDSDTCMCAARGGHLETLWYAHEHCCPWTRWTCYWIAQEGHLEVLQYAHEHGCPWDWEECLATALRYGHVDVGGHLEVLRYAHEHGCPWAIGLEAAPLPVLARRLPPGEGGHMRLRAAARAGTARASVMGPTPASQPIATNQVG